MTFFEVKNHAQPQGRNIMEIFRIQDKFLCCFKMFQGKQLCFYGCMIFCIDFFRQDYS